MLIQPLKLLFAACCLMIPIGLFAQDSNDPIAIFENILGPNESHALTEVVKAFEVHLDTTYHGMTKVKNIESYIDEINGLDPDKWYFDKDLKDLKEMVLSSKLSGALDMNPDSSAIIGDQLFLYYYYYDVLDSTGLRLKWVDTVIDTIALSEFNHRDHQALAITLDRHLSTLSSSKFLIALYCSNKKDSFIQEYIDASENGAPAASSYIIPWLLKWREKISPYFFDRILVKELFLPRLFKPKSPFQPDVKYYYLDQDFNETDLNHAYFVRSFKYLNDTTVKVIDFERDYERFQDSFLHITPDTWLPETLIAGKYNIQAREIYEIPDPGLSHIENGSFIRYKNGNISSTGSFRNFRRTGIFKEYYQHDQLKQVIKYDTSLNIDHAYLVLEYFDQQGNQLVINGTGKYKESIGYTITSEGEVYEGKKTGKWKGSQRFRYYTFEEIYIDGVLMEGTGFDREGKQFQYNAIFEPPEYIGGDQALFAYLGNEINYPYYARRMNVQGRVYVQFTVDKFGNTTEVKALNSLLPSLDKEAVRVIEKADNFYPGKIRGQPSGVTMVIPVIFKLLD